MDEAPVLQSWRRYIRDISERSAAVGFRCVRTAGPDEECANKPWCAEVGACNLRDDDQCVATSHEACKKSRACRTEGHCVLHRDDCGPPP
jgi:hypothetical protein